VIWSLLRTRRWLGFTALVVFVIVAFGLLSLWQLQRADVKREQRIELANALAADPLPLERVVLDGGAIIPTDEWRAVTVTGAYVPGAQVLVRKRPLDARNGFWAMTPLRTASGTTVWVNRGWLPTAGDALSAREAPAPPAGEVSVTGYLRPFEDADPDANAGLPPGQVAAVAPALLPEISDGFTGYVQLATSQPQQDDLVALPLPTVDESRNVSYAIQWLIFAAVAISGWFFFLRREAIEDAQRATADELSAAPTGGA
jgi:cytochrome oxidase assembly protein ShyY1